MPGRFITGSLILIGLLLYELPSASQNNARVAAEYPTPDVREDQTVIVDGFAEIWQLKWKRRVSDIMCGPSEMAFTGPCQGFGFGEGGEVDLIRLRNRVEVDRLPITPLFYEQFTGEGRIALIQRWQPDTRKDFKLSQRADFPTLVRKRPSVQVMHFADYDHDGWATEFYLQTEALPGGKSAGVVIGVSRKNPRLHALATTSKPANPLRMQKIAWEALRESSGSVDVVTWPCGDHGANSETITRIHCSPDGIEGVRREFDCKAGKIGPLIAEDPL